MVHFQSGNVPTIKCWAKVKVRKISLASKVSLNFRQLRLLSRRSSGAAATAGTVHWFLWPWWEKVGPGRVGARSCNFSAVHHRASHVHAERCFEVDLESRVCCEITCLFVSPLHAGRLLVDFSSVYHSSFAFSQNLFIVQLAAWTVLRTVWQTLLIKETWTGYCYLLHLYWINFYHFSNIFKGKISKLDRKYIK